MTTPIEKWWLKRLWSGCLWREMKEAESQCEKVQAKDFNVFNHDD